MSSPSDRVSQAPRPSLGWVAVIGLLGAGAAVHAALGSPGLSDLPGWFYRPTKPGLSVGVAGPLLLAAALGAGVAAHRLAARSWWAALLSVFAASLLAQAGLMALSAGGLGTYWLRLIGGHGEFLKIAHQQTDLLETLRGYERLVASEALGHFPPSKPPGALAIYGLIDRLGELLRGPLEPLVARAQLAGVAPHAAGAAVALWLLPVCTAGVAPLAASLAGDLAPHRHRGIVAGILVAFAPTTLLITHHLDGAVYPLFALGAACCWVRAARSTPSVRRLALLIGGGALLAFGVYTSFSLLPAGLLAGLLAAGVWWRRRRAQRADASDALTLFAGATLGFVVAGAVLMLALDFRPVLRFQGAMAHHEAWKAAVPTELWRLLAPVEFFLWVGWPMVLVWLAGLVPRRSEPTRWVGWVVLLLLSVSSALAGTNEVARLWAFLMPFIAVSVALGFRWRPMAWAALVLGQLATALALAAAGPW